MRIVGYSERGIINSIIYEVDKEGKEKSFQQLISNSIFGKKSKRQFQIDEVLIEQSFSDFGDADIVFLGKIGSKKCSVFVEAKVRAQKKPKTDTEFKNFCDGKKYEGNSSNLFTQIYFKMRLFQAIKSKNWKKLEKGVRFPKWSSKKFRKIGEHPVVRKAAKKISEYTDRAYYLAIVPETTICLLSSSDNLKKIRKKGTSGDWENVKFLPWAGVHNYCLTQKLSQSCNVFDFNAGQIY